MAPDTGELVAAIYNDAYMVRRWVRGGRTTIGREERQAAIHKLGLTVRRAFDTSEDYEALLTAVYHGLAPNADPPF